jgi:hypothetical protein
MMPYDTYRLYQVGRAKSPAEVRSADERAGGLAAAASRLFRAVTRPARRRYPAIARGGAPGTAEPASRCWPEPNPASGAAAHESA